jgi:hypothetical protein
MSGGAFNYDQYKIGYMVDQIEEVVVKNGVEKTPEDLKEEGWRDPDWYKKYPEDLFHYKYPDEVIEKMKEGIEVLKRAQIYAQRIDWLLSGDDGEESFLRRLEEELNELNK